MQAKYTAKWGVQIAGMIFQIRSRVCLHETSLLCLWMRNGCFLYAQHNFCSKNTIFISEAAVSSAFFCNVADRLDSHSVSGTLGRLENMIFLLYFPFKGIFHLDQEKVLVMKVNLCMDSPVERLCFQAGFQSIFQKVGENQAHIDLVYGNVGWQSCICLERNVLPFCQSGIMADHAVSRLVFTKMQVVVWNVVPVLPPLWQSKGSHIVPAEGRENGFPAEALHFYSGCWPS